MYLENAILVHHRHERKVAVLAAGARVDARDELCADGNVDWARREEHAFQVRGPEALVHRRERHPAHLRVDQVRTVRHDRSQSVMLLLRVPCGDEVHVVRALVPALGVDTRLARELDLHTLEQRRVGHRVDLAYELGVEVHLVCESRDCNKGGVSAHRARQRRSDRHAVPATSHARTSHAYAPHAQKRRNRLVEEARVHVRSLLQDDHIAARALGCGNLPPCSCQPRPRPQSRIEALSIPAAISYTPSRIFAHLRASYRVRAAIPLTEILRSNFP